MELNCYIVNIKLPDDLLKTLQYEACDIGSYNVSGYPGSNNLNSFIEKLIHKKSAGPQSVKPASAQSKTRLENLIGGIQSEKCTILKCEPNFTITPHVDQQSVGYRKSCLTWVLFPENIDDCAPTLFYNDKNNVIASHKYDRNAFILDTRLKHGMINNNNTRILVQLTFNLEPSELKERIIC
jgi:hypothetical protein